MIEIEKFDLKTALRYFPDVSSIYLGRPKMQELEDILHLPVDVVSYRPNMNVFLKKCIDRDAVYV